MGLLVSLSVGVQIVCCGMAKLLLGDDVGITRTCVCREWVDDGEDGCRWVWKLW